MYNTPHVWYSSACSSSALLNGAKGLEDRHPAALLLSKVGQEKCLQQGIQNRPMRRYYNKVKSLQDASCAMRGFIMIATRCLLRDEGLYNDSDMTACWLRESRVEFCCESKQVPKDLMDGHPTHM